ncbi:MAG: SIS domain-containing protein, partial [Desulfomonilaceae bacterium]
MCGIAGFLSNEAWKNDSDLNWVHQIADSLDGICRESFDIGQLRNSVDRLIKKFDELMTFSFHFELASKSEFYSQVDSMANRLEKILSQLASEPPTEEVESLQQDIGDAIWQIRAEVLQNVSRTNELMNPALLAKSPNRSQRFVAWSIEKVLENIDRLEVRGRDSAGIAVQCLIDQNTCLPQVPELGKERLLDKRSRIVDGVKIGFNGNQLDSRGFVLTFIYKVANLVGRLGDNTSHIRKAVRNDKELWRIAAFIEKANIVAHTRWASNGIISLANCHP